MASSLMQSLKSGVQRGVRGLIAEVVPNEKIPASEVKRRIIDEYVLLNTDERLERITDILNGMIGAPSPAPAKTWQEPIHNWARLSAVLIVAKYSSTLNFIAKSISEEDWAAVQSVEEEIIELLGQTDLFQGAVEAAKSRKRNLPGDRLPKAPGGFRWERGGGAIRLMHRKTGIEAGRVEARSRDYLVVAPGHKKRSFKDHYNAVAALARWIKGGPRHNPVTAVGAERAAEEIFGTTSNPAEAGYILTDGTMIDFSGKRQGGSPGVRHMDHREIWAALDAIGADYPGHTEGMVMFMDLTGAARVGFYDDFATYEAIGEPTVRQAQTFARHARGKQEVMIDVAEDKESWGRSRGKTLEFPGVAQIMQAMGR